MDDFLYNLRTGNLKRGDRDHRQGRGSQYKGPQRRTGGDRRHVGPDLEAVSGQLTAIEKNLKVIANEQRRIADAAEREADTLDLIAQYIKRKELPTAAPGATEGAQEDLTPLSNPALESALEPPVVAQDMDRPKVIDLIKSLRAQKMSFAKIAEHLEAQGIATLSGRGKWYPNTVSKLLQSEDELLS